MGLLPLSVHAPWTEVLKAIGVAVPSHSLPCRVQCPKCEGARLTIFEDTISGGTWHYCFDCHQTGDIIELAASVWEVPVGVAVRRLVKEGVPLPPERVDAATINKYLTTFPEYRGRVNGLWQKAAEHLPRTTSRAMRGLKRKFRLDADIPLARWDESMGKMVGGTTHLAVERTFQPKSVVGNRCVSRGRTFKGRGWGDLITVPYHDLPGRICGFLFVGRQGKKEDRLFRVPHMKRFDGTLSEGGLACWHGGEKCTFLADHVVAVGDPFLALRLQVKHHVTARTPLPLVAYHDGTRARTKNAWKGLDSKTPVLWGWKVTPSLVYQAIVSNGKLVTTHLDEANPQRVDHFIRDNDPRQLMLRLVKKARPWREFLAEWADTVADGAVSNLLLGLETYGIMPESLIELSPRIKAMANIPEKPKQAQLGRFTVVEKDGMWWETRPPRKTTGGKRTEQEPVLVMNAMLRIDGHCLLKTATDTEVAQYKGRLIKDGEQVPFAYSIITLAQYGPTLMAGLWAKHHPTAKPLYIAPGWKGKLMQAALIFSGLV